MRGMNYFENVFEYNLFTTGLISIVSIELIVLFFIHKDRRKLKKSDHMSFYLIIIGWILSIESGQYFRSISRAEYIRNMLLPDFFFYIGIMFVYAGIIIRVISILTLKKAFSYKIIISENQDLVTTGIYSFVRNPAYLGSIFNLLGISLAYRNVYSIIFTLAICMICYIYRIKIEESTLKLQFKEEFEKYCKSTKYRLIPYVF